MSGDQRRQPGAPPPPSPPGSLIGSGSGSPSTSLTSCTVASASASEIAGAELRRHVRWMTRLATAVMSGIHQPVAGLRTFAVVLGDDDQHAVVDALARASIRRTRAGVLLDGFWLGAGTISTCSWLPLRCRSASACCSSCFAAASSVPVVSTTGASSAGMAASEPAAPTPRPVAQRQPQHDDGERLHAHDGPSPAPLRIGRGTAINPPARVAAGCGAGACAGVAWLKSTFGAFWICASFSTVKFGLVW